MGIDRFLVPFLTFEKKLKNDIFYMGLSKFSLGSARFPLKIAYSWIPESGTYFEGLILADYTADFSQSYLCFGGCRRPSKRAHFALIWP
jgi:hypothetical protein